MKRFGRYTFAAFTASACFVFSLFTNSLYLYTDNVGVALVLNGYYAGPFSQYQHPLLCLLVNAPEKLFPSADVYTAFVHVLIFAELFVLALLLPEDALKKKFTERQFRDHLSPVLSVLLIVCIAIAVLFIPRIATVKNYYGEYYITRTGNKYHKKDCVYVKDKTNTHRMTIEEFESGEFEPCKICLPDE